MEKCTRCENGDNWERFVSSLRKRLGYNPWKCDLCHVRFYSYAQACLHFASPFTRHPGADVTLSEEMTPADEARLLRLTNAEHPHGPPLGLRDVRGAFPSPPSPPEPGARLADTAEFLEQSIELALDLDEDLGPPDFQMEEFTGPSETRLGAQVVDLSSDSDNEDENDGNQPITDPSPSEQPPLNRAPSDTRPRAPISSSPRLNSSQKATRPGPMRGPDTTMSPVSAALQAFRPFLNTSSAAEPSIPPAAPVTSAQPPVPSPESSSQEQEDFKIPFPKLLAAQSAPPCTAAPKVELMLCTLCNQAVVARLSELSAHVESIHLDSPGYHCRFCSHRARVWSLLVAHHGRRHPLLPLQPNLYQQLGADAGARVWILGRAFPLLPSPMPAAPLPLTKLCAPPRAPSPPASSQPTPHLFTTPLSARPPRPTYSTPIVCAPPTPLFTTPASDPRSQPNHTAQAYNTPTPNEPPRQPSLPSPEISDPAQTSGEKSSQSVGEAEGSTTPLNTSPPCLTDKTDKAQEAKKTNKTQKVDQTEKTDKSNKPENCDNPKNMVKIIKSEKEKNPVKADRIPIVCALCKASVIRKSVRNHCESKHTSPDVKLSCRICIFQTPRFDKIARHYTALHKAKPPSIDAYRKDILHLKKEGELMMLKCFPGVNFKTL